MHHNTRFQSVDINEISPIVLKSYFYTGNENHPGGYKLPPRHVYDYELEFYTESDGRMIVEGVEFPIHKGDIVFRRPGQYVQGILPYTCYTVCFDLLGNTGKSSYSYNFSKKQVFQINYKNSLLDCIPPVTHAEHPNRFEVIFDGILREYMADPEPGNLLLKAYVLELIHYLYKENQKGSSGLKAGNPYISRIREVKDYIGKHLHRKILLAELASIAGMSPNYFHRIFTNTVGITPNEYILSKRMEKARELLVRTRLPISEVALICGYENIPYFSTAFKKHNQMAPGEYRDYYTKFGS
jgi:AraC family transcriptional regulator